MANMFIDAMTGLWTSAGTTYSAIKMNISDAGSAAASKLLQLQIGGVDKFSVGKGGDVAAAGTVTAAALESIGDLTLGLGTINGTPFATAQARNRIINPAMQISQENGNTSSTLSTFYIADQWAPNFSTSAGTITSQRVQSVTPNGSKDRLRMTITVADASLAATEYLHIATPIEGTRVADFMYGTASAQQSILRFGFKGPAGTYAAKIGNAGDTRSYVATFTISGGEANTNTEQTFVIPGDTSGTWLTDTGVGMNVFIVLASGATYQGTTGWQAGNFLGTSGVTNGMATLGAVYEVFDVGLYLDPDSTGNAPPWQMPDEAEELRACWRYFSTMNSGGSAFKQFGMGLSTSTTTAVFVVYLPGGKMRTFPAFSASAAGDFDFTTLTMDCPGNDVVRLIGTGRTFSPGAGVAVNLQADLTTSAALYFNARF